MDRGAPLGSPRPSPAGSYFGIALLILASCERPARKATSASAPVASGGGGAGAKGARPLDVTFSVECPPPIERGGLPESFESLAGAKEALREVLAKAAETSDPQQYARLQIAAKNIATSDEGARRVLCAVSAVAVPGVYADVEAVAAKGTNEWFSRCLKPGDFSIRFNRSDVRWDEGWHFLALPSGRILRQIDRFPYGYDGTSFDRTPEFRSVGGLIAVETYKARWVCPIDKQNGCKPDDDCFQGCWPRDEGPSCNGDPGAACLRDGYEGWWALFDPATDQYRQIDYLLAAERPRLDGGVVHCSKGTKAGVVPRE